MTVVERERERQVAVLQERRRLAGLLTDTETAANLLHALKADREVLVEEQILEGAINIIVNYQKHLRCQLVK